MADVQLKQTFYFLLCLIPASPDLSAKLRSVAYACALFAPWPGMGPVSSSQARKWETELGLPADGAEITPLLCLGKEQPPTARCIFRQR